MITKVKVITEILIMKMKKRDHLKILCKIMDAEWFWIFLDNVEISNF